MRAALERQPPPARSACAGAMVITPQPGRPARGSTTGRPIMALFDLAGRRWTLRISWELDRAGRPLTFRELRGCCDDLSSSVLTRRLRELTEARIVTRADDGYALTTTGRRLVASLEPALAWARDWSRELAGGESPDSLPVTIVHACQRGGSGGSPTAVLDDTALSDEDRCAVPVRMGTSHAVFVSVDDGPDGPAVSLRFFTSNGELPACGHGTVAALACLAQRGGHKDYRATIRTAARVFTGWAVRDEDRYDAAFDLGSIEVREPTAGESGPVLDAVGITPETLAPGTRVASPGRPRLLVPVSTRSALAALAPDFDRLRDACDRLGLLGCYVYSVPTAQGSVAARLFAPSIGVPEDIANANSTACLAAYLAGQGITGITADMGDTLGSPSTITAGALPGETGPLVHVGGVATIARVVSCSRVSHVD